MVSINASHWDAIFVLVSRCSPENSISSLSPLIRGDFTHCWWWTKEASKRGFAAARARGLPARQNDDVLLVFGKHPSSGSGVAGRGEILELRGLFGQVEAHGNSLPESLGKVLQISAGRKRRADAGLGFDGINRLLQDGRFAEHGVNTQFAQEIARISRHLHLEHHVVVDNRYLGMGLVAGCGIKRGETITGYGGVCHGRRASVPESHLPWVLRCKDSDSVFDGFESERSPPSMWGALVNSCLGLEGISQNVDYQFERAPGAAVGRLDASEPPYVAVIRATRDIATGEQLYSAYSLRSSVVLGEVASSRWRYPWRGSGGQLAEGPKVSCLLSRRQSSPRISRRLLGFARTSQRAKDRRWRWPFAKCEAPTLDQRRCRARWDSPRQGLPRWRFFSQ